MGIKERREREKEQRQLDIINAAERVFFSKGIDQATMDEVAQEAELSKGTLYLYFSSKEDLYMAIINRAHEILFKMFKDAVKSKRKGRGKIRAIGQAYFDFYLNQSNYFQALMYFENNHVYGCEANCTHAQVCQEANKELMEMVIQAIKCGIEDGSIRKNLDPVTTSLLLWGKSIGVMQVLSQKGAFIEEAFHISPNDLIKDFFEFMEYSLAPH